MTQAPRIRLGWLSLGLWAACAFSPAGAHPPSPPHAAHATAPSADATWIDAEVRRIDRAAGTLTLRHGEIQALDMPPMTMVFHVRDPALLAPLKVGSQIQVQVMQEPGRLVITALRVTP